MPRKTATPATPKKAAAAPGPVPAAAAGTGRGDYAAYRDAQAAVSRARSATGRDLGGIPEVADPGRKAAALANFRAFCESYFAELFALAWSDDHLTALSRMEEAAVGGGQFALAMARGSGKTTMAECLALWAVLSGRRRFVMVVAATAGKATEILDRLKAALETNDLLAADFPEVCFAVRALERIYNRANGQTVGGRPTRIGWTKHEVILPSVAGSPCSGSVLRVAGITGAVRGAKHVTAEGQSLRPDLALVDDPQTEKSAHSPQQCNSREEVIRRAVLGLAGPGKRIACVMLCTVIAKGDLADRFLDRRKHPGWHGERMRLLYGRPKAVGLWDEYARIRAADLAGGGRGERATAFYAANRAAMDEGGRAAWEARRNPDELSALQHAMNLELDDPAGFRAEYQNDPDDPGEAAAAAATRLTPEGLASKCLPQLRRAIAPREATRVTAMIDVQQRVLFWLVAAWDERFGGAVIDYGAYPDQSRFYFTAADPRPTLADAHPGIETTAQIYAGLAAVADRLFGRTYPLQESAAELPLARLLVDANWGESTDAIYEFARNSEHAARILPSHGKGYTGAMRPMADEKLMPGEMAGPGWRLRPPTGPGRGRRVIVDTNHWKTFVAARLVSPLASAGSLALFAPPADGHRLLFDHLVSEQAKTPEGRDRTAAEWRRRPNLTENHWWDCLVGSAAAASIDGLRFDPAAAAGAARRPDGPVSFAEQQRQARARRAAGG